MTGTWISAWRTLEELNATVRICVRFNIKLLVQMERAGAGTRDGCSDATSVSCGGCGVDREAI